LYKRNYENSFEFVEGIVTVGGFRTSYLSGIIGILLGHSQRASRDMGIPNIKLPVLVNWAHKQIEFIDNTLIDESSKISIAKVANAFCNETGNLKIAYHKNGAVNYKEIKDIVEKGSYDNYIIFPYYRINRYLNSELIDFNENVFWTKTGYPTILQSRNLYSIETWPYESKRVKYDYIRKNLDGKIIKAIADAWKCDINKVYKVSNFTNENDVFSAIVGKINGNDFTIEDVYIIRKP
jgi:hypothetical protein